MKRIVIVVNGGLVSDVLSDDEDVEVTVCDLDTDEGYALWEKIEIPGHNVY